MDWRKGAQGSHLSPIYDVKTGGRGLRADFMVSHFRALVQALRQGASQSVNQTGQQVVGRYLNIQPTLTIRPGFRVRVIVNRDLVLEPYQG
jgi:type IV secretory pathway VirB10-like protein